MRKQAKSTKYLSGTWSGGVVGVVLLFGYGYWELPGRLRRESDRPGNFNGPLIKNQRLVLRISKASRPRDYRILCER